jgi:FkbM family methyltransferase
MFSLKNKLNGIKEMWKFDNRFQLIFNRIFFPSENISFYRFKNVEFLNDHAAGDSNGARELLNSPMYQSYLGTLKFTKPINVLDLGSNNGGFALLLKSNNFEVKKLVCVEVNPETFTRLRFNIARNFDCELRLLNIAVCGENKELEISFEKGDVGNSIYQQTNKQTNKQIVQGISFDELFNQNFTDEEEIDICKIDVEGAEFEILLSENHSKITNCKHILMEIHHEKGRDREIVRNKLKELGFIEKSGENKNEQDKHYVHFFENEK